MLTRKEHKHVATKIRFKQPSLANYELIHKTQHCTGK